MIDRQKLATAVRLRRGKLSLRDAAEEAGVPYSTLKRTEYEDSLPNLDNFAKLCRWMEAPMSFFVLDPEKKGRAAEREAVAT